MKVKKKIGDIFRDELKAVEITPPDDVWNNIELSLERNRKKRFAIPFWYKAAGIAAVFAVIVGVLLSPNSELESSIDSKVSDVGVERRLREHSFQRFNEIMEESSTLLQDLVLQSQELAASLNQESKSGILHRAGPKSELQNASRMNPNPIVYSSAFSFPLSIQKSSDPVDEKEGGLVALDEEVTAPDSKEEEENLINRLAISTTAGIVYSDNLGKGNFLDRDLSTYSGQGETSVSYGIKLSYELANRISIRTGFNSLNLGYRTDDVDISSVIAADAVDAGGIDYNYLYTGDLHQNLGFFEIPVELSYALVDKRLRLNLIGGVSTLLLDTNSLSLNGPDSNINLGAANNLNNISISGNFGLGVDYSLQNNLHLTLEPILKYQFNTFRNPSSGIAPYMIGFYSGLTFKF